MRLIVLGALVVAALAIGLLVEVTRHTAVAPTAAAQPSAAAPAAAPSTPAAPAIPATSAGDVHARAMAPSHVAATAAPSLAPAGPAPATGDAKPKHVDTPTDILRWSLMRAIRNSEPAVIECLDKAKAAGPALDGRAVFAFYVTTKNGKAVISRPGLEVSPFPDAANACLQATLASGELDQELPEGQTEFRVLRELVVDKGAITQYKLKSFLPP